MTLIPAPQLILVLFSSSLAAPAEPFRGWQDMRVIRQRGQPVRVHSADLDGDHREELIVVNTRQSRLEVYRWLPPDKRQAPPALDPDRPNDLPMAPDVDRVEISLEQLPYDTLAAEVDGDGRPELLVLAGSPNKVILLAHVEEKGWTERRSWNLLSGSFSSRGRLLLLRSGEQHKRELLVSFEEGIQRLVLEPEARASWFEPQEKGGRLDWWLLDADGDGDLDLVEWRSEAEGSVRWYQAVEQRLLPPQVLYERPLQAAAVLGRKESAAELLLLSRIEEGLLRRYALSHGEESPLGRQRPLPLPQGDKAPWCGVLVDGRPTLVAADPERPRLLAHTLGEEGWQLPETFPAVGGVEALAAPQARPGTVLLWVKDAGDLYASRWQDGRFSYPKPMGLSQDVEDRRIVGLGMAGDTTWWIQRVADHVDLYLWAPESPEPVRERFEGAGAKVHQALWLGGRKLLALDQYARSPKLVTLEDGKTSVGQPAHLKNAKLDEFHLLALGDALRPARAAEGVLQWLDENLRPEDQIMLSEGQGLVSFVPLSGSGEAWALEAGGKFIHLLAPDAAGIQRVQKTIRLSGAKALRRDAVLGLVLQTHQGVIQLSAGCPRKLSLLQTIDGREGAPSGVREPAIHRLFVTDITGGSDDEAVLSDDRRHQLTVMAPGQDGDLKALISWPVFEDRKYPYDEEGEKLVTEPRAVVGLDFDGDDHQDLAMLSHDRLILYIHRRGD